MERNKLREGGNSVDPSCLTIHDNLNTMTARLEDKRRFFFGNRFIKTEPEVGQFCVESVQ